MSQVVKRKIGRKIIIFVMAVTVLQITVTQHYNSILKGANITTTSSLPTTKHSVDTLTKWEQYKRKYPVAALSDNQQFVAYVDNKNILHITNLINNHEITKDSNTSYLIDYLDWVGTTRVFVGGKDNGGDIYLNTVDASTETAHALPAFTGLGPNDRIKKIAYSVATNDIYILIGDEYTATVYHYNTNSDRTQLNLGYPDIRKIQVTLTTNKLYFEAYFKGTFNIMSYTPNDGVQIVKRDGALVSVIDNTLYFGSINSDGLVTAVYKMNGSSSTLVKRFKTPELSDNIIVAKEGNVYVQ